MTLKRFLPLLVLTCMSSWAFADCFQSVEFGLGWRRDDLKWNADRIVDYSHCAVADSDIHFKDIDIYTLHAQAKWADTQYYIRLSGDYGLSEKGRATQLFDINAPILGRDTLSACVNDPVKRRSEFYDIKAAAGYPFMFDDCHLMVVPLLGFSFNRQRIRVKQHEERSFCSSFCFEECSNPFGVSSVSDLLSSSECCHDCFDPFESFSSPSNIASLIGFCPRSHTSMYRFTWYGPFIGTDIAYALDSCWTIFAELEYHFLNRCHRKRHSNTAVDFVDSYHSKGYSQGFNGSIGTTYSLSNCWFATLAVNFNWEKSTVHQDSLRWKTTGINWTLGYTF
jgi:hypothetical protein